MTLSLDEIKNIIASAIFSTSQPLSIDKMQQLFQEEEVSKIDILNALSALEEDYKDHTLALIQVASGYRFQIRQQYASWIIKLWEEKPSRYSRALLETLVLIAYRQPITRGEIEDVRGVAVSSHIIKTLLDREWVRVVGHRDLPGRPALFATTKLFLDYFNLKTLEELPTLAELQNLDELEDKLGSQLEINLEIDAMIPEPEEDVAVTQPSMTMEQYQEELITEEVE